MPKLVGITTAFLEVAVIVLQLWLHSWRNNTEIKDEDMMDESDTKTRQG